jgi:hypothetical protein
VNTSPTDYRISKQMQMMTSGAVATYRTDFALHCAAAFALLP